jgi:hypothetical protein
LLAEVALVVLTMLFVSERSWKHHFVTLLLPYTYLVWEFYFPRNRRGPDWPLGGVLIASFVLMATTSSEFGGLFADGKGHEIAQGYGMFLWAAVLIYAAVARRLWVRRGDHAAGLAPSEPGHAPHLAYKKADAGRLVAG